MALLVIGVQDVIQLLVNNATSSLFSFIPGDFTVHIAVGVVVAIAGVLLAGYAKKQPS